MNCNGTWNIRLLRCSWFNLWHLYWSVRICGKTVPLCWKDCNFQAISYALKHGVWVLSWTVSNYSKSTTDYLLSWCFDKTDNWSVDNLLPLFPQQLLPELRQCVCRTDQVLGEHHSYLGYRFIQFDPDCEGNRHITNEDLWTISFPQSPQWPFIFHSLSPQSQLLPADLRTFCTLYST